MIVFILKEEQKKEQSAAAKLIQSTWIASSGFGLGFLFCFLMYTPA